MTAFRTAVVTCVTALAGALLLTPQAQANGCVFAEFGGGNGTTEPLVVSTATHLERLQSDSRCWGYDFVQTADISMGGATWTSGIGDSATAFSGIYDGGGHTISDLNIDESSTNYLGLFGKVEGATAAISRLNFSGTVSGKIFAGGLVGYNLGDVQDSSFTGSVTGTEFIGGLVGRNEGQIQRSFAAGNGLVEATNDIAGGLVGSNSANVFDSFAAIAVTSRDTAAGLIGDQATLGQVRYSYATGVLTSAFAKGLIDGQDRSLASYWNTETTGTQSSDSGTGKTTDQMKELSTFSGWSIEEGWDATATWGLCYQVNSGYPFLTVFYTADPCTSDAVGSQSAQPITYEFTFWLPDGRECTSISPVAVTDGTTYTLPGEDAACVVEGSAVTGWRIPGQSSAFAPGRSVEVSGSQRFTAVLEYSWVEVIFDANVARADQCLFDGADSSVRETSWWVPRELLTTGSVPVPADATCAPPRHVLAGWKLDLAGNREVEAFLPSPTVDSDGNAANTLRLYAIWVAS